MVPAFSAWVGLPLKETIATSLACVGIFAIPGTITHCVARPHRLDVRDRRCAIGVIPGAQIGAHLTIGSTRPHAAATSVGAVLGIIAVDLRGRRDRRARSTERDARARRTPRRASAGVSRPVNVFCWLGWNAPTIGDATARRPRGRARTAGRGAGSSTPGDARSADHTRLVAERAERRRSRARRSSSSSSRTRYGAALRRARPASACSPAARSAPRRRCTRRAARRPSSRATDVGWFAKPLRCSDANRKSPDRSPVNTRPVRLPPCAAGARPTTQHAGVAGRRSPGTGRPQYVLVAERGALLARDLLRATRRAAGTRGTSTISARRARRDRGATRHGTDRDAYGAHAPIPSRPMRVAAARQRDRVVGDGAQARR